MTDFAVQRKNMICSQVMPSDIANRAIPRAMGEIPREAFVPAAMAALAYMDGPVTVLGPRPGRGARALMAPRTFAMLLDLAAIGPGDRVLDAGCATGYGVAVLSRLAGAVTGLESDADLASEARARLAELAPGAGAIVTGDLDRGHAAGAPYDVIFLEGSVPEIPAALFDQLADGGRLAAIVTGGGIARAAVWRRSGAVFGKAAAFDATAPALPGFEKKPQFAL